jgi:hypothetical protein
MAQLSRNTLFREQSTPLRDSRAGGSCLPWFNDQWTKLKAGTKRAYAGARERAKRIRFDRPPKTFFIWAGSIVGALLIAFVTLNVLLANPSTGTPMVNWAIGTFGDRTAKVQTGHLEHPFSSKFVLRTLEWPDTVTAREIDVHYDLFGFLPGRVWANEIRIRDGEILLEEKSENEAKTTFNPQQWVNRIDAKDVDIRFTRNDQPRLVKIVTAQGSFADGSVKAEAVAGTNRITFDGLQRDWGGALKGQVTAKGENLKLLADIVGASAPDTPPFDLKGALSVQAQTWSVEDLSGRMGDSDLGGLVRINLAQEKPFLTVALKSNELDFDDLGVVFGIPVGTGRGETTNETQVQAKAAYDRSARLIPDAEIDFTRLAAVNADIDFDAAKVVDAPVGINAISLKGTLRDSVLDFERAVVKSGSGDLDAKIRIDAQKDPADTRATGTLSNVAITRVIPTDMVRGTLQGRFALSFTGSGFRDAVGSSNGELGLWSNNSELSKFATEGAGLDLGEILLLWATEDKDEPEYIKSRCLAANIAVKNGQATLQPAVIDNEDSLVAASGGVNLKTEAMDIEIYARPHDVSIGTISGDIRIGGTLRNPSFEALNEETLLQAGIAGLLSTITGALGLVPFVQTGGEPEAPCATLLADAKETNTRRNPAAGVDPKKSEG